MKNNFKLIITSIAIVMALTLPLQLPSFADTKDSTLNKEITAFTKEPISKRKIAFKFLMAMAGVATSSVVIYVGLSVYNKLFKTESSAAIGLNSLRTPENFKDAINIFLNKTNWD